MTNSPINVVSTSSSTSIKASASKEASPNSSQEFGNALARQMENTDKTETSSKSSQNNSDSQSTSAASESKEKSVSMNKNADNTEASGNDVSTPNGVTPPNDTTLQAATSFPVDALLQTDTQSPIDAKSQPDAMLASLAIKVEQPYAQQTENTKITGKNASPFSHIPKDALLATGVTSGKTAPMLEQGLATTLQPNLGGKNTADTLKAKGAIEINNQSARLGTLGDITANPQHASTALTTASVTSTSSPTHINTPLMHTNWGEDLGQKVAWMATQRHQSAELHLNPPNLGPLDVALKLQGDQATAIFTSPHAAVRDAIEQAMPKLREMLAESGIMLGNATVSDQAAHKNNDNNPKKSSNSKIASNEAIAMGNTPKTHITTIRSPQGMVDTFA